MFRRTSRPVPAARRPQTRRPRLEALEARELLALFTVTNNADSGAGSLRAAIIAANADTDLGADSISFQIGSGLQTIALQSALPALTRSVVIDGSTQPRGSVGGTSPVVVIDGTNAGAGSNGLTLSGGSGSVIRGVSIVGFNASGANGGAGILVNSQATGITVLNCYVGLLPDGQTARPNANGVVIATDGNAIGAVGATNFNVISGNRNAGILIAGAGATGNVVRNNRIGTDDTGFFGVGNTFGVVVAAPNNTIGGTSTADRNLIAGNVGPTGQTGVGILLQGNARGVAIRGNLIGTDLSAGTGVTTTRAVPNVYGIYFGTPGGSTTDAVTRDTVGGTVAGAGNIISGNFIGITGNATALLIAGNTIGLAGPGSSTAVANSIGIQLGASGTTIGGTTTAARNVIAASSGSGGSSGTGLELTGDANLVQGNYIGAPVASASDLAANAALRNVTGVSLHVTNSTIGGTAQGAGNIISGNLGDGIVLGTEAGNRIQGNSIGLTPDLQGPLPNGKSGVAIVLTTPTPAPTTPLALNLTIGGTAQGAGNTIANNVGSNVVVRGTYPTGITGLSIRGNSIFGNQRPGIDLNNSGVPASPTLFITSSTLVNGMNVVAGYLTGSPSSLYEVDLYGNTTAAPIATSGYGPGQVYLGSKTIATDGAGQATFSFTVASFAAYSSTVTGPAGNTSEFSANFPTSASIPRANLVMSSSASSTRVTEGSTLTLTEKVVNNGPASATNVRLFDTLPLSFLNARVTTSRGTVTLSGNVVSAVIGTLAPGQSVTVTITGVASQRGSLIDTAGVSSATLDRTPADNSTSQTITVTPPVVVTNADLSITSTASPAGRVGADLTYTLTVVNNGPAQATNVTVNEFLPIAATLIAALPSQGAAPSVNGTLITSNLGTIAAGGTATLTIIIRPTTTGTLVNAANVSGNQFDPVPANNSTSVSTDITTPNVSLALSVQSIPSDGTVGRVGQIQLFVFTVTNTGTDPATNVTLINNLPPNIVFVQAAPTQGAFPTPVNGVITANIGTLAPGASAMLTIVVVPTANGGLVDVGGAYTPDVPTLPATFAFGGVVVEPVTPVAQGPTVTGLLGTGNNSQLVIQFSDPLNARTATRRANYAVALVTPSGRLRQIGVASATYNSAANRAMLVLTEPLKRQRSYQLIVIGEAPSGIRDTQGRRLAGAASGAAGTNFLTTFSPKDLAQV